MEQEQELFQEIASVDFLNFSFGSKAYSQQLKDAFKRSGLVCGVTCLIRYINGIKVVWMRHEFDFIGGSLGCAEGEKLSRGFEYASSEGLPVIIEIRSGGARMQEGTLSLMQMAKVSVAVRAFKSKHLPFITVFQDPTFGGTTASYAMQSDIRIGVYGGRIGFAGEKVILNTVYRMDQEAFDKACPKGFQSAQFLHDHGQVDLVVQQDDIDSTVSNILRILKAKQTGVMIDKPIEVEKRGTIERKFSYTTSRTDTRVQAIDILEHLFDGFIELRGDGKQGADKCIRGGIALYHNYPCVVIATRKGHNPQEMIESNYGMASPAGYRTATRLMLLAEQFALPVITLVDTPGAYPSFESEIEGQPEAIATSLLTMAGLKVPIITVMVGEGGSGGALGIAMGNIIGMLSGGYYGVITPEGAASILCRYSSDEDKANRFHHDCEEISQKQQIYCVDLKRLGVIDEIIDEVDKETYDNCPILLKRVNEFITNSLTTLLKMEPSELVLTRSKKFRLMGIYGHCNPTPKNSSPVPRLGGATPAPIASYKPVATPQQIITTQSGNAAGLINFIADVTVNANISLRNKNVPSDCFVIKHLEPEKIIEKARIDSPKGILDSQGPDALVDWIRNQKEILITDTTMRDAQQSLLATRVRTADLLSVAEEHSCQLDHAFSMEMWGGATFDVCYSFLHESPWERLRLLRKRIPNILFQMLLRGRNAVGYTNYPDNLIKEFVFQAAKNGMDVFRIFDCFNDVSSMVTCVKAVKEAKKIAECCICFTGNFMSPDEHIYTLDYYKEVAKKINEIGAHCIAIKDMAGLFKPQMAKPFMNAMKEVTDLPIFFHSHNTSGTIINTLIALTEAGIAGVDVALPAMSDCTSQPSMGAFLACIEGSERAPQINYRKLERLDSHWRNIRSLYFTNESGMKGGTTKVYDHQMPGGQYSNLQAQCKALGLWERWDEITKMYSDVNKVLGDIIKVTPSSKVVGDLALFLVNKGLKAEDVLNPNIPIEFPESVVGLASGKLGYPHRGFPDKFIERVLGKNKVIKVNEKLVDMDFSQAKTYLQNKYGRVFKMEEIVSYGLYPKQFEAYLEFYKKYGGDYLLTLPTLVFLYGMNINQTINVYSIDPDNLEDVTIKLIRVGPLTLEDTRSLAFVANGCRHDVKINETQGQRCTLQPADKKNITHLASPLLGNVGTVFVKEGDEVVKGAPIMTVEAMKMKITVGAQFDGVVKKIVACEDSKVEKDTLLAIIIPSTTEK
ncbi:pyruvate carboxylase subunit B, putative [Entamoeba dispar SAW760]|uniref:acetyl-CoA carboxytransferase n=1 Tax=Entamoeba dispar (strain ATCC PRA-260 / SAW760) TaxID=370354 RepID=B0EBA3_ENTDS|nr:pyruvate carboxylase subunit B, putative [Entamoeba dispar SAW760]EDR28192.1 pyruvate carboxylase subunit B, putative [Entamoeba dispar SAW760]|eukprot:EDR28192.1 pyruvate carboxylase subunit B, putative [Entamoeba dispar SAW760]